MTELMLRPGWPNTFRRRVGGKNPRLIEFLPTVPVKVSEAEFKMLKADIGLALFEVERDEKGRPRFMESTIEPVPTERSEETVSEVVAHV